MQKRDVKRGRPRGTTTYDPKPAQAFGDAVRSARLAGGLHRKNWPLWPELSARTWARWNAGSICPHWH